MREVLNFIDGSFRPASSGAWLDNVNPATGRVEGRIASTEASDVAQAADAAKRAFDDWANTPIGERSAVLSRIADLIDAKREELAQAEVADTGKPISLARGLDIPRAAENFRFFASAIANTATTAHAMTGSAINYTLRKPRGVAGCISPWNLPLYLFTWKIAPALASGCSVVAKPSELTPTTAFMLCDICNEAGLPPGVLNVVHGLGPSAGAPIIEHPDIPSISFTGGTSTGEWIARTAGPMFKRLSLELGGKNPYVVFADADIDLAIETGVRAAFLNQGEICLCGSRIYVEQDVYDRFVSGLVERAKARRIGDPTDDTTEHGALVSADHLAKVASRVDRARELGGEVLCGGQRVDPSRLPERCRDGFFYEPTVIAGLDPGCDVEQEEIFGPVVSVTPFRSDEEALRLANGVKYGLAASVWTNDVTRAHRFAGALEAGVVWVNCWLLRDLRTPFGGMKQSGVGREGGDEALRFFTEPKNVCVRL